MLKGNPNSEALEPPPDIPDHQLLRSIGRGAYGEVWLARNLTGAYRAVKVVYRSRFETEKPFNREFEGIEQYEPVSRLHPSQLDILHVGNSPTKDYFYYVMELADDRATGPVRAKAFQPEDYVPKTLRSELADGKALPLEACVDLGLSLTTALDNLHGHHLVHRDIKPSNIVYVNGEPKLADIGLVTSLEADMSIVGTPGFIAPEGPGTIQADLYGLGKTLYEAATGKDRQEFPESPTLSDSVSLEADYMELHAVLLKACETVPRDRYPTAQSMNTDLMVLKKGKSVKRLHFVERRLKLFTKIGIGAAILTILAVSATLYQRQINERTTQSALQLKESLRTADINLYLANIPLADKEINDADLPNARKRLEKHLPKDGFDLRGWEWFWLWNRSKGDQTDQFNPSRSQGNGRHLSYSNDGAYLTNGTSIWNLSTKREVSLLPAGERPLEFSPSSNLLTTTNEESTSVYDTTTWTKKYLELIPNARASAYSEDGKWLATGHTDQGLILWNLVTGEIVQREHGLRFESVFNETGLAFSPDGMMLVTVTGTTWNHGSEVVFWSVPDLQKRQNLTLPIDNAVVARFSPDGKSVLTGDWTGRIRVWDFPLTGWPERRRFEERSVNFSKHSSWIYDLTFARGDNNRFATVGGDLIVNIWNFETNRLTESIKGHYHSAEARSLAFSPDGQTLAAQGISGVVNLFESQPDRSKDVLELGMNAFPLGISSDSQTLVTMSQTSVKFWDISTEALNETRSMGSAEDMLQILQTDSSVAIRATISPNLKSLAVGKINGELVIWDVDTWTKTNIDAPHGGSGVRAIAFSHDSKSLATMGQDGFLKTWDVVSRKLSNEVALPFSLDPSSAYSTVHFTVVFSADGKTLAVCNARTIGILDVDTFTWKTRIDTTQLLGLALSYDGKRLATGHRRPQVELWDTETGERLLVDTNYRKYSFSTSISKSGDTVIGGSGDGTLRFFNIAAKESALTVRRHDGRVIDTRLSPDGKILITTDEEGTIKLLRADLPG